MTDERSDSEQPLGWFTDPWGVRRHGVEQGPPGSTDFVPDDRHGTCGASTRGWGGATLGPCVLRHRHEDPVHEDANGCTWTMHPAMSSGDSSSPLREQIAAALRRLDEEGGPPTPGGNRLEEADAVLAVRDREMEQLRDELAGAKATIEHMSTAMSWISGHDRQGLDHLEEAQQEAADRFAAEQTIERVRALPTRPEVRSATKPDSVDYLTGYRHAMNRVQRALDNPPTQTDTDPNSEENTP